MLYKHYFPFTKNFISIIDINTFYDKFYSATKNNLPILQKSFTTILCTIIIQFVAAQSNGYPPKNWHLLDYKKTGYYGISLDLALSVVKNKPTTPITVAVIDSGIDTTHEDLQQVLWKNTKEILGNGKDDDNNGYVDDYYGWNFLGSTNGKSYTNDTYEYQRVYFMYKDSIAIWVNPNIAQQQKIKLFEKAKQVFETEKGVFYATQPDQYSKSFDSYNDAEIKILAALKKKDFTLSNIKTLIEKNQLINEANIASTYLNEFSVKTSKELQEEIKYAIQNNKANWEIYHTPPRNFRLEGTNDNEWNTQTNTYGNADVMVDRAMHGTHCSGIIAANRNNGIGINGIAPNANIMMLRVVPNGDEHDKDIANAIRYAVNNGARIINMSFGKALSPQKYLIDSAVAYANEHNVLLIHSAGNDGKNVDIERSYPNAYISDGTLKATNYITVGASGPNQKENNVFAYFSNYGKASVDVFAPGVDIYSTVPTKNSYEQASGTSMAAPVVSGVAALVLNYYPNITATQLAQLIRKAVIYPDTKHSINEKMVPFSELSISGGIINAHLALLLAAELQTNINKNE
jgi:cell wall-associated protease